MTFKWLKNTPHNKNSSNAECTLQLTLKHIFQLQSINWGTTLYFFTRFTRFTILGRQIFVQKKFLVNIQFLTIRRNQWQNIYHILQKLQCIKICISNYYVRFTNTPQNPKFNRIVLWFFPKTSLLPPGPWVFPPGPSLFPARPWCSRLALPWFPIRD